MTKKAPKAPKINPPIQINRSRGGGKKRPDLFERLRNDEHPIDTLLAASSPSVRNTEAVDAHITEETGAHISEKVDALSRETLDAQSRENSDAHFQNHTGAHILKPVDAQISIESDAHIGENSDAHSKQIAGAHTAVALDAQIQTEPDAHNNTHPDAHTPTTRTPIDLTSGRPVAEKLDAKTPSKAKQAPTQPTIADAKAPTVKTAGARKTELPKPDHLYRTTDRLALRPDKEILKKMKIFCVQKNLKLTEFVELACLKFMEMDAQIDGTVGVKTPLDDRRIMMMYKSKPFIINLYLGYNSIFNELSSSEGKPWSARWNPRDDEAAFRFNNVSTTIIELGIIQTQIQKGIGTARIQSFKYYTDEIQKVISSGVSDQMLETILIYHRSIWRNETGREVDLSFLEPEKSEGKGQ